MTKPSPEAPTGADPYQGNVLVSGLGPILSPESVLKEMTHLPRLPPSMDGVPRHVRLHHLMSVRDLHVPTVASRRLHQSIDLMTRQGYRYRDPRSAGTWGAISGESQRRGIVLPTMMAAALEGLPGVGKTQACTRCFRCYPRQVIPHESFPKTIGGLQQVAYLSAEVPPSGKSSDLARALMEAWRDATGSSRFDAWLAKERIPDGMRALEEWRQVAVAGFLGILHLDEIQNLFKLSSLRQRRDRKGSADIPELSIVEDQLLRWILRFNNSGQAPLLVSGTPDGIGALARRLSTLQRINTGGYHSFEPIMVTRGRSIETSMLGQLFKYQFAKQPLAMDEGAVNLIVDLTGGIQRIIIALWIAAHRVAFERKSDDLLKEDFVTAAETWLAPLAPAVAALRSKDASRLARYEDLVRRDTVFWAKFWRDVGPQ
jgi:hypothetical protein